MLHKTKSRKVAILKYGLSAPLFAGMLIFSSATGANINTIAMVEKTVAPLIQKNELEKPQPPVFKKNLNVKKRILTPDDTVRNAAGPVAAPKNLYDFVSAIYLPTGMSKVGKEGNIYVSFKVGVDKRPIDFKIQKSIGSKWEMELIAGLEAFSDTVDIPIGKYHFSLGFAYGGNEDLVNIIGKDPALLFRRWKVEGPGVGTATEMENGIEVHNTYVSFISMPDPIVLVDGKQVAYTATKMGLKLEQSIYPRVSGSSKALKGDKAVEIYGEQSRKGIIVIETKEKDY